MSEDSDSNQINDVQDIHSSMFTQVEREILICLLEEGDNVPANISRSIERNRSGVSDRLSDLRESDLVHNKGSGVWTLTEKGVNVAQVLRRESLREDGSEDSSG